MVLMKKSFKPRSRVFRRRRQGRSKFVSKVRSVLQRSFEKKYLAFRSTYPPSTTPYLLKLSEVTQGITDVSRIGDRLHIKSLQFNYTITTPNAANVVRVIIFQWFNTTNTAYPAASDVLLDTATYPWLSPYAHDRRLEFRILYDKTHILESANQNIVRQKVFIKKIPNKHRVMQFIGATSTAYVNGLFALLISDQAAATFPTLNYSGKFNFTDA